MVDLSSVFSIRVPYLPNYPYTDISGKGSAVRPSPWRSWMAGGIWVFAHHHHLTQWWLNNRKSLYQYRVPAKIFFANHSQMTNQPVFCVAVPKGSSRLNKEMNNQFSTSLLNHLLASAWYLSIDNIQNVRTATQEHGPSLLVVLNSGSGEYRSDI